LDGLGYGYPAVPDESNCVFWKGSLKNLIMAIEAKAEG
jgi:hypothetical protein